MNDFLTKAKSYAREIWCWDDPTFFDELYETSVPFEGMSPEDWIDWLADKYNLEKPEYFGMENH